MARLATFVFLTPDVAPCHGLLCSTAAQSPRQWLASSVRMPAASSVGMHSSHVKAAKHYDVRPDTRQAGFSGPGIHQLQLIKGRDPKIFTNGLFSYQADFSQH